jgi:Zn-finger nucleic acid-binding protein
VSSEIPAPKCPQCGAELRLAASGRLDAWSCPAGHGVGLTVSEAYERLQDDEVHAIWQATRDAEAGSRTCPMCSQPMVAVTLAVGGPGSPEETLDVCREDELIWFDAGELDEFPPHSDTPLSADEQRKIEQIRATFDHELDEALAEEDSEGTMNRFANHVVRKHPGFVHLLDHVVYGHELDDVEDAHAA